MIPLVLGKLGLVLAGAHLAVPSFRGCGSGDSLFLGLSGASGALRGADQGWGVFLGDWGRRGPASGTLRLAGLRVQRGLCTAGREASARAALCRGGAGSLWAAMASGVLSACC